MVNVFACTVHVCITQKSKDPAIPTHGPKKHHIYKHYVLSQVHLHVDCASLEQFLLCVFIVCEIILSVYTVHISVYIH